MFRNREDAGRQLAARLKDRPFHRPIVLAIPRGGVIIGAILAEELGADLDVVLSRKLRAPGQAELALGAVAEDGQVVFSHPSEGYLNGLKDYLEQEREHQLEEIARRQKLFRTAGRPQKVTGRSVIVTDDGIATGSTMTAALQALEAHVPLEVIVAVPVAPSDRLDEIRRWCDDIVCLLLPREFWAVGQFYADFSEVQDAEVVERLRQFSSPRAQPREQKPHNERVTVPLT